MSTEILSIDQFMSDFQDARVRQAEEKRRQVLIKKVQLSHKMQDSFKKRIQSALERIINSGEVFDIEISYKIEFSDYKEFNESDYSDVILDTTCAISLVCEDKGYSCTHEVEYYKDSHGNCSNCYLTIKLPTKELFFEMHRETKVKIVSLILAKQLAQL